jgi:hypothetical protein
MGQYTGDVPLSRADEDLLGAFHLNLRPEPLTPDHPFFVTAEEFGDSVGDDVVTFLRRDIERSETGSVTYLSGFRGAGKTTQLNRLKRDLEADGYAVVLFDTATLLNLNFAIEANDLVLAVPAGIAEQCVAAGWVSDVVDGRRVHRRWFDRFTRIRPDKPFKLSLPIDPGTGDSAIEISPFEMFRLQDSFRDELRDFMRDNESALKREATRFVADLIADTKKAFEKDRRPWRGFVVIADSLDHASSESNFEEVAASLREVFDARAELLRFDGCQMVYCIPPYLQLRKLRVRTNYNVKVTDRDGDRHEAGHQALRLMLARRVPTGTTLSDYFTDADLDELIQKSGGHIRDLLLLVDDATIQTNELPITSRTVSKAIRDVREQLKPLKPSHAAWLAEVHRTHEFALDEDGWLIPAEMISRHLVLRYPNDDPWFDVHPLLADYVERAEYARD